jgi:hypothetical protein
VRAKVRKYLLYWQKRVISLGVDHVTNELSNPKLTRFLDRKDRMELLRELGLREQKK